MNRFSSDTYTIDDTLPFILNILIAQLAGLVGTLVICLYGMPWLVLLIIPMCPIYLSIQSRYRNSSRDIKRLSSNAMSPIYTHFTETVQGLATIRSMRATGRFHRDFLVKVSVLFTYIYCLLSLSSFSNGISFYFVLFFLC